MTVTEDPPGFDHHLDHADRHAEDQADRISDRHQANRADKARRIADALTARVGPGTAAGLTCHQIAVLAQTQLDPDGWTKVAAIIGEKPPSTATQCLVVTHLRAMDVVR